MYRLSPFTYLVSGMLSTILANARVICADVEYLHFDPPANHTCASYLAPYISAAGGYVLDGDATADCHFCSLADTNAFLASFHSYYADRWRNLGILAAFVVTNAIGAVGLYWLWRVPKGGGVRRVKRVKEE